MFIWIEAMTNTIKKPKDAQGKNSIYKFMPNKDNKW